MLSVLTAIICYLIVYFWLCRNSGRCWSPVSATEWFTEGLFVSSHRQSEAAETGRTKPSLPRPNHLKLGVQALEVKRQIFKGGVGNKA